MYDDAPSVLIVEDNRAMTQVLRFNFERAGFSASVAFDGLEALRLLQERSFDLVLTDYQMPHMDGAELCRQIREVLQLTDLPIALCSAKGLEADAANLVIAHGVHHVFYKPISPQAIVAYARKLLDKSALAPSCPLAVCH
jgi:CheY-like chemotaxis protein